MNAFQEPMYELACDGDDCLRIICGEQAAFAQEKYDTGATDTEIKIGNIIYNPSASLSWRASCSRDADS